MSQANHKTSGLFFFTLESGKEVKILYRFRDGFIWVISFYSIQDGQSCLFDETYYRAGYQLGLEAVDQCISDNDVANINNLLGQMVVEFCTDRMLLTHDGMDYRKATLDEAMDSLTAASGLIEVDDNTYCYVQF